MVAAMTICVSLLCSFALSFLSVVVHIDSAEVTKNCLLPMLQVFCMLDKVDADNHFHHVYQILFTGDMELAVARNLLATLVSEMAVLVEMPACVGSFINNYALVNAKMVERGKTMEAAAKAQTSAVGNYVRNKELQKFKVLMDFKKTGEKLTNEVFSPGSSNRAILPKSVIIQVLFGYKGKAYNCTNLYVGFTIA